MEKKISKRTKIDMYIFGLLFFAVSISLFWKCRFGYAQLDEAFYPTIGYRFIQGDAIMYDEWNNSQLSSLLLVPFLKIYKAICGNMDGIYLSIRYTYTVFKILISLLIYYKLKFINKLGSAISSLIFLSFAGSGLMVLSYVSFASGGILCSLLFLINEDSVSQRRKNINYFLAGISLSVAVMAIPYLSIIYILYIVSTIVVSLLNRKRKKVGIVYTMYSFDTLIKMSIGVMLCVGIFILYVVTHSDIKQIINTIPYIVLGDPAHQVKSLYLLTLGYLARIVVGNHRNFYLFVVYLLLGCVVFCYLFDKKHKIHKKKYETIVVVLCILLSFVYLFTHTFINDYVWVANVLAFVFIIFEKKEIMSRLFYCIWIPGMIYTYLYYLASNTGFEAISTASCVSSVASILIIVMIIDEKVNEDVINTILLKAFVLFTWLFVIYYRLSNVYWEDGGIKAQTREITYGPDKGLLVSEEKYNYYNNIYCDTALIRAMPQDTKVLYLSDKSLWLAGNQRCASYSPLCYSIESSNILYQYYSVHPEKRADIIYVDELYGKDIAEQLSEKLNMKINAVNNGWILTK